MASSITTWHRLEPISRSSDFDTAVAAEIRDPLWMLSRQRRIGETRGEDTGSPAFVRIGYKAAPLHNLILTPLDGSPVTVPLDAGKPIEGQILPEPHAPDLATAVELSLTFFEILDETFAPTNTSAIKTAFLAEDSLALAAPQGTDFNPVDEDTMAFSQMTDGRVLDGVLAYQTAKAGQIPAGVQAILTGNQGDTLQTAYTGFVQWVEGVFGQIGTSDPAGWNRSRLDYDAKMTLGTNDAMTLAVHPNENGSVDWSSFDVDSTAADPFPATLSTQVAREMPVHVRFPGMPAPRFWDFESGDLPWPDLDVARSELARLLVVDFAMLYGVDWFVAGLELDVGTAAKIDTVVVYDVFGGRTIIDRVEDGRTTTTPSDRFTMYNIAAPGGTVGNFMALPPIAGRALQHGPALEEVRFARDEMADMAWGIEAVTPSRIGERRRGSQLDAAVDAATKPPPAPPATSAPLQFSIESKVPVHWIPLLVPNTNGAPTTELEKGATVRLNSADTLAAVPALGKILNPTGLTTASYRVFDEEIPKSGVRVERIVYRARAQDGRSFMWVARRKRSGAGETQSGLRFDSALPTQK
jgi:hypothetical protein